MTVAYEVNEMQYELVYDVLSFALASMMACTLFLWFRVSEVHKQYRSALLNSGLVTFIASYHYIRIFNSWVGAYEYAPAKCDAEGTCAIYAPMPTGIPFNDAYRYMDWLLTVPLLLIEIILVMKLDSKTATKKSWTLGSAAALMIILGYPGELILDPKMLNIRWAFWAAAVIPFCYIVYELMIG